MEEKEMTFEDAMLDWEMQVFPIPECKEMAKFFYVAGLLHAAEQDEKEAESPDVKDHQWGGAPHFRESAAMHRQAASEVK